MAKKKGKKRGQGPSQKQNLLRAYARRAMPNLPPGAQLRIEPRGEQRMSEVLEAFVEPYLGLASTDNGQRALLEIASLAWNAAILPEDKLVGTQRAQPLASHHAVKIAARLIQGW